MTRCTLWGGASWLLFSVTLARLLSVRLELGAREHSPPGDP